MKNAKTGRSLKFKLMGLSLGVTALMGAASLGVLSHIARTQEESSYTGLSAHAELLGDAIAAQFFERYGDVQTFSINPDIRSSDRETIVTALNTFSALYGIYDLIMVVDARGRLVAVNSKAPDGKDLPVQPLYRHNYGQAPWFKSAMAGQFTEDKDKGFSGTYVEDVHVDPWVSEVLGGKRLASSFTTTVKGSRGEVLGVITNRAGSRWFEVAFKAAYAKLRQVGYPHARLDFLGKDGQLLFHYRSDAASEKLADSQYDWDSLLKANPAAAGNPAAKEAVKGQSGSTLATGEDGQASIVGYTPVDGAKFINSIGWSVMVSDSRDEALSKLTAAKRAFYLIFAVIIALVSVAAYLFSTTLSKRLTTLAEHLSRGSSQVSSAASDISTSSTELSEAATEQAAAIQETAASIDEVSAMIKKSSDNASQSQTVSQSSRSNAERGQVAVQEMTQAINDISQSNASIMAQVEDGNRRISEIVKVIAEIGNKTKVINDIVFQTKLLSFNASVEAARAGEHGKGFAVVAEEVGNLAQMSGNAAKEISSMLESSIQKVESIVNETKSQVERLVVDGRAKVEIGTQVAEKCGEALRDILTTVQQVDGMVEEISSASKEQAQGVSEINKAMNQLDQVTQRNTGVSLQAATSAEQLSKQARELRGVVSDLTFLINGNAEPLAETAPATQGPAKGSHAAEPSNLVSLESKRPKPRRELKIAAGEGTTRESAVGAPSKDDPRFEDI